MEALIKGISRVNDALAEKAKWLLAILVLLVSFDVFMRYALNSPTAWGFDLACMLGACFYTLGLGYVEKCRGNVRVDLFSAKMPEKLKISIDVFATIFVFIPTYIFLTWFFWENAIYSLSVGQKAVTSTWYPYLWPIKIVIACGFTMQVLQLCANALEDLMKIKRLKK